MCTSLLNTCFARGHGLLLGQSWILSLRPSPPPSKHLGMPSQNPPIPLLTPRYPFACRRSFATWLAETKDNKRLFVLAHTRHKHSDVPDLPSATDVGSSSMHYFTTPCSILLPETKRSFEPLLSQNPWHSAR